MRAISALLAAAAMVASSLGAANAAEEKLIFATLNPANARISTELLHPWAERINKAGKGIISIDVRDGYTLANFENVYGRVVNDVVQIGFALTTAIGGKFPLAGVIALPVWDKSQDAAVAFWRLYASGLLDKEFDEVVPLWLSPTSQAGAHLRKAPAAIDDLSGLKLIVSGKVPGQVAERLGATPLSVPMTDLYGALQRGTADGAVLAWTSFNPFKLGEVTSYHIDTELGGNGTMIFMSKKRFDALSPEAKKILTDNSGEAQSRRGGAWWDEEAARGRASVAHDPKHTVIVPSAEQAAKLRQKITPVVQAWAASGPEAKKVLDTFEAEIAKAKAGQ
jgi:TRAP-type C4-dicarboxylate transport system substrate-binding protein